MAIEPALRPLRRALVAFGALAGLNPSAVADDPPAKLAQCAEIGAPADRLVCYDRLAGRAPPQPSPAEVPLPSAAASAVAAPAATTRLAAQGMAHSPATEAAGEPSLLSAYWELDPKDKRGIFTLLGYRPNYLLPLHQTTGINRAPQSPTHAAVTQPEYRNLEAKFQVSLRTKVAQNLLLPGADLWLGFTEQALWQVWNDKDSTPFRNTDYEPEAMYVVPVPEGLRQLPFGWQWRYAIAGLAHQSNGQADPLSRSWNRSYLGAGFEHGDWSLSARVADRFNEPLATDDNPDLLDYRGRAEFQLNWTGGLATAAMLVRTTLKNTNRGSLQFDLTYPLRSDQPNGVRWYLQVFDGYAETLTDYNFRQTSLGVGLSFLQF